MFFRVFRSRFWWDSKGNPKETMQPLGAAFLFGGPTKWWFPFWPPFKNPTNTGVSPKRTQPCWGASSHFETNPYTLNLRGAADAAPPGPLQQASEQGRWVWSFWRGSCLGLSRGIHGKKNKNTTKQSIVGVPRFNTFRHQGWLAQYIIALLKVHSYKSTWTWLTLEGSTN